MIEMIIGTYGFVCWLVFKKFKLIPINTYTIMSALMGGVVLLLFIWIVLAATYRSLSTPAGPRIDSPTDSGLAAVSTTPSAVAVGERQD